MGTQGGNLPPEGPKNAVGIPGAPSQPPAQPEMQAAYSHLYKGTSPVPLRSVVITPSSDPPFGTVFTLWISLNLPKIFADCQLAPSAPLSSLPPRSHLRTLPSEARSDGSIVLLSESPLPWGSDVGLQGCMNALKLEQTGSVSTYAWPRGSAKLLTPWRVNIMDSS